MKEADRQKEKCFVKICRKVGKAIYEYSLIEDGDRILVGLSGGKDSMILLEALADRKRHLPIDFEIFAIHIAASNIGYMMDTQYLSDFCKDLNVPLFLEEIEVDLSIDSKKAPCFVCSWHRRKRIFDKSKELKCNKVAFGHHKDDAIETMLLNMIYHGSYSSLPQKLRMFDGRIHLIRPLLFIPEAELSEYADLRSFKKQEKSCPYDNTTRRNSVKKLIGELSILNKSAGKNLFRAMDNIYEEYLPKIKSKTEEQFEKDDK